jgi:pimeloyl-ACP methyl ester carboxylesterase
MVKTVVITIHGQESIGKNMADLSYLLSQEEFMDNCTFINLRYEKLLTIFNIRGRTRRMTAKYIAARLNGICLQYPNARIIIIAHSNGTRAARIAMDMRLKPRKKWPMFRVDNLILLGCPIKRNYRWTKHPATMVYNFASVNDNVVWLARFYGMGSAGRYKFKHEGPNLTQYFVKWGHSGFVDHYPVLSGCMRSIMGKVKLSNGKN